VLASCARAVPPSPDVARRAAGLASYSASLRVSVSGGSLRGRSRALVAFRRPDALRIEIPGPSGARLVAVARDGRLTAVLPADRAVLESEASPAGFESLIGIALRPEELMDLLVGVAPAGARRYEARWGTVLPSRIDAVLADGTKLTVTVEDADAGESLAAAAFDPPPHAGHRGVDADEARRLLGGR
jgi:outer membrane lipoprotein-sorting protein